MTAFILSTAVTLIVWWLGGSVLLTMILSTLAYLVVMAVVGD